MIISCFLAKAHNYYCKILSGLRVMVLVVLVVALQSLSHTVRAEAVLLLKPYPHARVVEKSQLQRDDYRLTLGALKKINNVLRTEREQRLMGLLQRETLELPQGHTVEDAFKHYLKQLQAYSLRELFSCLGRACGSSNSWANNRFKVKQLYGLDQYQHYGAYELEDSDSRIFYVALYGVVRGNKRVYIHLETLRTELGSQLHLAADPSMILSQLQKRGFIVVPDLVMSETEKDVRIGVQAEHLQALVAAMKLEPGLRVMVVGHDYAEGTFEQKHGRSLQYAKQVRDILLKKGIKTERIGVYAVGNLAPAGHDGHSVRIEIVRLP